MHLWGVAGEAVAVVGSAAVGPERQLRAGPAEEMEEVPGPGR